MADDDLAQRLYRLEALAELQKLKARYYRFVDTKDWDGLRSLYLPDAVLISRGIPRHGPEEIVDYIKGRLVGETVSVHHGHMPELEVTGDQATGIWAFEDWVQAADGRGFWGCGHYHERYRRTPDGWKFEFSELKRLLFRPHPEGAMPGTVLPPELASSG
jgi:hypothetical protein